MAVWIKPEARATFRFDFAAHRGSAGTRALMDATQGQLVTVGQAAAPLPTMIKRVAAVEDFNPLDFYTAAAALGATHPLDVSPYILCGDARSHRYVLWVWDNVKSVEKPQEPEGDERTAVPPCVGGRTNQQEPQGPAPEAARLYQPEKDASPGFRMCGRKWIRDAILVHYRKRDIVRPVRDEDLEEHLEFRWMEAGETLPAKPWTMSKVVDPTPQMRAQMRALVEAQPGKPFPPRRRAK